jgi:hypothetical protein
MRSEEQETVEVAVEYIHETALAYLFSDGDRQAWLPKSQVTVVVDKGGKPSLIVIPEWLAKRAGFI